MQDEHLKMVDAKEREKQRQIQEKIMNEKNSRDIQLRKSQHQRRKEARENLDGEKKFVQKHLDDAENERLINLEKKRQEREYFGKMMEENTRN